MGFGDRISSFDQLLAHVHPFLSTNESNLFSLTKSMSSHSVAHSYCPSADSNTTVYTYSKPNLQSQLIKSGKSLGFRNAGVFKNVLFKTNTIFSKNLVNQLEAEYAGPSTNLNVKYIEHSKKDKVFVVQCVQKLGKHVLAGLETVLLDKSFIFTPALSVKVRDTVITVKTQNKETIHANIYHKFDNDVSVCVDVSKAKDWDALGGVGVEGRNSSAFCTLDSKLNLRSALKRSLWGNFVFTASGSVNLQTSKCTFDAGFSLDS